MGITAAAMTNLMSLSRILYSYAKDGLFFKVFKEIDPVTNVPVKGGWISILPVCLCAFLMNLTQLAKLCSLCNLVTYSFIDAAVIALRLKPLKESGLNQGGGIRSRQNRIKKILL
jgi:APA family basic amino acid/polyamine antiporter